MLWPRIRPAFRLGRKPLPALFAAALALMLGACESKPLAVPPNLIVSAEAPRVWPTAPVMPPDGAPRIVQMWISSLTLEPGIWFSGTILASTNVASVEVRSAAFSINSTHAAPGLFRFHTRILELPPLSRRHSYELSIIARNTAGEQVKEHATLAVR
jgi:hypothetical protein